MSEPKLPKQEIITLEPQLGGWISDFTGVTIPNEGEPGQYKYSFGMSAVRPGKKGHIGPAEIFNNKSITDANTDINSLPRAVDVDTSQSPNVEWYITGGLSGTAPKVVKVVSGAVVDAGSNLTQVPRTISALTGNFTTIPSAGTGFWGEDIIFYTGYQSGSIIRMILYSYNTSADGFVGLYDIDTGSFISDDFFSSTYFSGATRLATNVPHRFCVGPDKILYVTNGRYIASYDATSAGSSTNGTYNNAALDLGLGWIATDVQPYGQNYIAISMVKTGTNYIKPSSSSEQCESRIVLWNGSDLDFTQLYILDDWYCNSIKIAEGVFYAFTQGKNGTIKVKILNPFFQKFETVWEAPISVVGNAPFPNQAEWFNEMLQWVGDTTTNMVFALMQTATGFALHTPYYLSDGVNTMSGVGFLKNINSNILFIGANSNGYKIIGAYGDGSSNGSIIGSKSINNFLQHMTRLIDIPYRWSVVKLKAYFSSFGSASSGLISLVPDYTAYSTDGSGNVTGDKLKWVVNVSNHPNITNTMTASTAELGGKTIPDLSRFWLNFQPTNSSVSATPPILRKLEITIQETMKP